MDDLKLIVMDNIESIGEEVDKYLMEMKNYLREHYNVTAVNSGKSALKFLEGHECDLIFLDFICPFVFTLFIE